MTFLILSGLSGLVLTVATLWIAKDLRLRRKMPKWLFFKAGLALLIIEVIHLAAIGNASSIWPQINSWPTWLMAIVFGTTSGLFTELGRFLVLDKMMKNVRNFKEGVYFGLGWNGVSTAMIGVMLVIGVFGMMAFSTVTDLAAQFPDATAEQMEQLLSFQKQSVELMHGNPLVALMPVVERISVSMMDIALTLLILLCFQIGSYKYVWAAVGLKCGFGALLIYAASINDLLGESVFLVGGILAYFWIRQMRSIKYPGGFKAA